jgi:hypothetical protein
VPAEEAAQLAQSLNERVGVVGVELMVERQRGAATAGAIAQPGRHGCPLPVAVVADHRRRPPGAQVRRVTGSSDTPDSSHKTMTARGRRAWLPDPRPVTLHPSLDGLLVTLDGPAGRALPPPAQPTAPRLPHLPGM